MYNVCAPYTILPCRISIEIIYNHIYAAGIVRQLNYSFWPAEQFFKYLIRWTLSYHNRSGCCSLKIPVAHFDLIAPYIGKIHLTGINEKVSTPLSNISEKRPVLLGVDCQMSSDAVMKIKQIAFLDHS